MDIILNRFLDTAAGSSCNFIFGDDFSFLPIIIIGIFIAFFIFYLFSYREKRYLEIVKIIKKYGSLGLEDSIILDNDAKIIFFDSGLLPVTGYTEEQIASIFVIDNDKEVIFSEFNFSQDFEDGEKYEIKLSNFEEKCSKIEAQIFRLNFDRKQLILLKVENENKIKAPQKEQRYKRLFEFSPVGLLIIDDAMQVISVNQYLQDWLGFSIKEVQGKNLLELGIIDKDNFANIREKFSQRLDGKSVAAYIVSFKTRDGDEVYGEVTGARLDEYPLRFLIAIHDVTERIKAEKALQISQFKYRELIENINDIIYSIKPDGKIEYISPRIEQILLYNTDEIIGKSFIDFIFELDRRKIIERFQKISKGSSGSGEYRLLNKEGGICWVRLSSKPVFEGEKLVRITGVLTDIDKYKITEEQLGQAKTLLDAVINVLPEQFYVKDQDNRWVILNDAACDLIGIQRDELIGESLEKSLSKEYYELFTTKDSYVMEYGDAISISEIESEDGRNLAYRILKSSYFNSENKTNYIVGIMQDISDQRDYENALLENEKKYRLLFDKANDAILLMKDRKVVDCNLKALELYACNRNDIIGKVPTEFSPEYQPDGKKSDIVAKEKLRKALDNTHPEFYWKLKRKNGQLLDAEINLNSISISGDTYIQVIIKDISEKKKAEKALLKSEQKYKKLFRNSPVGIITIDNEGNIIDINQKLVEILGSPSIEATKKINLFKFKPLVKASITENFKKCIEDGENLIAESQYISKWNKKTYLRYHLSAISDRDANIEGVQAIVEDITVQKKAEYNFEFLYKSAIEFVKITEDKNVYQFIADKINQLVPDSFIIVNHYHQDRNENETVAISGFGDLANDVSKFLGSPLLGFTVEMDNPYAKNELLKNKLIHTGVGSYGLSFQKIPKAVANVIDRVFSVRKIYTIGFSHDQRLYGNAVIIKRNDEPINNVETLEMFVYQSSLALQRILIEKALKESEAHFKSLLYNANDYVIFQISRNKTTGDFSEWMISPSLYDIYGLEKQEIDTFEDLFKNLNADYEERIKNAIVRSFIEPYKFNEEFYSIHPDKGERFYHITTNGIKDENGNLKYINGIIIDDTNRIEAIQKHKKLEEQLIHSQKLESIGLLAGGIAHDFNNLLSPIIGYSELIMMNEDACRSFKSDIENIKKAAEKARKLTWQLLAFGRKQVLEMQVVRVNEIINDFISVIKRTIRENIDIELRLDKSISSVKADPAQLEQVIMNLVINSQDAMPKGGKFTIETTSVNIDKNYPELLEHIKQGSYNLIKFKDTGHGIKKEDLPKLFEPFFSTKDKSKGTGLGLATVYGIIRQHMGFVQVQSKLDEGTEFLIYIPETEVTKKKINCSKTKSPSRNTDKKIILAEDDSAVRELVNKILFRLGYETRMLEAARDYKKIDDLSEFDLLITDVIMPELNGKELYDLLKQHSPDLKVLFISGYTDEVIAEHGVLEKGVNFLQKPISIKDLSDKLDEIFEEN
ncbi:MAG: PAS domain S-box protein [Candidatus Zixiibacteriota bacterium]